MKYSSLIFILPLILFTCKEMPEPDDLNKGPEKIVDDSTDAELILDDERIMEMGEVKVASVMHQKKELLDQGFEVFEMVDEVSKDTVLMQKYFIAFLKSGPVRSQNEEEAKQLQIDHLSHLAKMYDLGYADISGPLGDDGEIRGITIYNTPTFELADSLANADPMVKAQRLVIEMHPWWAAKGFKLR